MSASRPIAVLVIAIALSSIRPHAQGVYDPEARLTELGLKLPSPGAPIANYVNVVRTGNLVFLAGHGECGDDFLKGKVGSAVESDQWLLRSSRGRFW